MQTTIVESENLFRLLYVFDVLAVVVFAVSGALVASRKRMDVMGFVWLAVVTGVGGGTLLEQQARGMAAAVSPALAPAATGPSPFVTGRFGAASSDAAMFTAATAEQTAVLSETLRKTEVNTDRIATALERPSTFRMNLGGAVP